MINKYKKYDLYNNAELALNYLEKMVDENLDYLPYWLVIPHGSPAYAKHCRVDDAELVASWYEGMDALQHILGDESGEAVKQGFYRHLMKSWGEHGLRFHENYPWTHTMHSSFHEMAYVLSALNRILLNNPDDTEVKMRGTELIRGLKKLVITRKKRTFWSGDYEETDPIYEFPNDVYLQDGGFNLECHTGRGEQPIRNGILLHPLVMFWELTGDEVALDLAKGIANYLLGASRYFNHKMEFFGHVHSAVWVASGLVRLGRLCENDVYLEKGKKIYDYVVSLSSTFGWVPEYAQWHEADEEFCETCCIKDMIECGKELIEAGYEEYYDLINKYGRNQLDENQIKDGSFAPVDTSMEESAEYTYKDIAQRIEGGFTGGSEPGSISLERFRSLAGCCAGTGPQALQLLWELAIHTVDNRLVVNMPINKVIDGVADIEMEYPNQGLMVIKTHKMMDVWVRTYEWMGQKIEIYVNGELQSVKIDEDKLIKLKDVPAGAVIKVVHELETVDVKETVRGVEYTVSWRGPDVVDLSPKANHIRLYQRDLTQERFYPTPEDIKNPDAQVVATPTN